MWTQMHPSALRYFGIKEETRTNRVPVVLASISMEIVDWKEKEKNRYPGPGCTLTTDKKINWTMMCNNTQ
jgi:hypothetical protein